MPHATEYDSGYAAALENLTGTPVPGDFKHWAWALLERDTIGTSHGWRVGYVYGASRVWQVSSVVIFERVIGTDALDASTSRVIPDGYALS